MMCVSQPTGVGPLCLPSPAAGQDDLTSPASVQRVRCAVLGCLRSMAADPGAGGPAVAGSSGGGAEVVGPLAGSMLPVVGEWMGDKQPAVLRERATQVGLSLHACLPGWPPPLITFIY